MSGAPQGADRPGSAVTSGEIAELVAKQKLYENLVMYCRGQDRKELDVMKSTFWPEATDNHGMFNGSAHEFCEWSYENQKTTRHKSHHYVTNVVIELDGDLAKRESSVVYVMVKAGDEPTDVMGGRYRDLCERRNGEWRVLRRMVIFDHVAQYPSSGELAAVFGGIPDTSRVGDVYPADPIYDAEW
ncbi:nuclear transport factor 2 family protein [Nocardia sp. NPDC019395]|uniref:nuclear transport factor 2 family protein n=1 Tax=Nocardia sp. NPDC019395 TaxID=3154686 RepID=UPI0033EB02EB